MGEGVAAGLVTAEPPPDPVLEALLRRVVVDARRVVEAGAALAGVDAGAGVLATGFTSTGFTSTVLFAAAVLRVVRRRGWEKEWPWIGRCGSGTETAEGSEGSLSVRIPEIDDATDGEIGENGVVRAGMPGS